jgi:cytoskeletal protein CcmA (bactofilin family)
MTQERSVVGEGARFEGKVAVRGDARVDGEVRGEIRTDGTLVIGASGRVQAEVEAGDALIEGELAGTLRAKGRIEVAAGARVEGSLDAPRLVVREGAVICARVRMGEPAV